MSIIFCQEEQHPVDTDYEEHTECPSCNVVGMKTDGDGYWLCIPDGHTLADLIYALALRKGQATKEGQEEEVARLQRLLNETQTLQAKNVNQQEKT
jgi:ribosomal protein L37AE/L43A